MEEDNYHNDHRVQALNSEGLQVDAARMVATITWEGEPDDPDADYIEHSVEVPIRFEVCSVCDGKGTHVNPSIDANGISGQDFRDDPDFAESYFAGNYDVPCYGCNGQNVEPLLVTDPEKLTKRQREAVEWHEAAMWADADFAAEEEAERRFGC